MVDQTMVRSPPQGNSKEFHHLQAEQDLTQWWQFERPKIIRTLDFAAISVSGKFATI
jgi:hypothetical protein